MKRMVVAIGQAGIQNALALDDSCAVRLFPDGRRALDFLCTEAVAHVAFIVVDPSAASADLTWEIRHRFPGIPLLELVSPFRTESELEVVAPHPTEQSVPGQESGLAWRSNSAWQLGDGDLAGAEAVRDDSAWGERLRILLPQVARSDAPVLLQGETGVGKEVVARCLHARSERAHRPFLKVNCAALPSELIESELFGYERGAFTGAVQNKLGKFELANSGTVLLDEIGDMDIRLQAKLLQFLQDQTFDRLGGKQMVRVDVRVIAATHCDLENAALEGRFRRDLYYRLNVITIRVPSLRDRRDEILPLCKHLMTKHAPQSTRIPELPDSLKAALVAYDWPGNVRELENIIRRLLIIRDPQVIEHDLQMAQTLRQQKAAEAKVSSERLLQPSSRPHHGSPLRQLENANREAETSSILAALEAARWNRRNAASFLGISYKTLLYRMHKHGLDRHPRNEDWSLVNRRARISPAAEPLTQDELRVMSTNSPL